MNAREAAERWQDASSIDEFCLGELCEILDAMAEFVQSAQQPAALDQRDSGGENQSYVPAGK